MSRKDNSVESKRDAEPAPERDEKEQKQKDERAEKLTYYHHRLHRVDAEALLRNAGDFILRKMIHGKSEKYVVSVRWSGEVRHFKAEREQGRYCFEGRSFVKLKDLLEWHVKTGTALTEATGARVERSIDRKPWELLKKQLEMGKQLGKGNFGAVMKATVSLPGQPKREAAVKTLTKISGEGKDGHILERARTEMLMEARIMRICGGHRNIVEALGVTIDEEIPMAVMELIKGDSLEKILRKEDSKVSQKEKERLVYEAALGLAHIHSKDHLHRDLAARNCMVEQNGKELGALKLIDFGMARRVGPDGLYHLDTCKQIPVAWSALESLIGFDWYVESDWWMWACMAWEIFSDGSIPWNDINDAGRDALILHLKANNRLEKPQGVKDTVYNIMRKCWEVERTKRPKADEILNVIKPK